MGRRHHRLSVVVLENLIDQFVYSKAAQGSSPSGNSNKK
jgi:phospholipid/cholesterol/gamma-HCH transport system substrate-binding protein